MLNKQIIITSNILILLLFGVPTFIFPENNGFELDNQNNNKNQQAIPLTSNTIIRKWNYVTSQNIEHLAISDDGRYICASLGQNLTLFDNDNNKTLLNYDMNSYIYSIDISSRGDYIAVGNEDGNVTLFNCTKLDKNKPEWSYNTGNFIYSVAISPDGKYIVAGDANFTFSEGYVYLFNNSKTESKDYEWKFNANGEVMAVDIGYDPAEDIYYIVGGNVYGQIYFFNNTQENPKSEIWKYITKEPVNEIDISHDGRYFAVHYSEKDILYTFNKSSSESQPPMGFYPILKEDLAISPDGGFVTVGNTNEYNTYLFNNLLGEPIWKAKSGNSVNSVAISLYGNYILAGSVDNNIYLYHKSSNNSIWNYDSGAEVKLVALSSNGSYIAGVACDESSVHTIYLFFHDIPKPQGNPIIFDVDDDSNGETKSVISFGNYYILFVTIGLTTLIIIIRRKTIYIKN